METACEEAFLTCARHFGARSISREAFMAKAKLPATAAAVEPTLASPALRHDPALRRVQRFARIPDAIRYAGIGKSKLYDKAKERIDLMRRWDDRTLVDLDVLDEILDGLPTLHAEQS
jgi:hypothetical protein